MRLYLALRREGLSVGFKRLRRLLRSNGIFHRYHRKYIATTDSNHNLARLPNLIDRQFNLHSPLIFAQLIRNFRPVVHPLAGFARGASSDIPATSST